MVGVRVDSHGKIKVIKIVQKLKEFLEILEANTL